MNGKDGGTMDGQVIGDDGPLVSWGEICEICHNGYDSRAFDLWAPGLGTSVRVCPQCFRAGPGVVAEGLRKEALRRIEEARRAATEWEKVAATVESMTPDQWQILGPMDDPF